MRMKSLLAAVLLTLGGATLALAQDEMGEGTRIDVYGFAMLDMGYQFNQNDPDWFDVVRPTKLPAFENEFGEDGHFFSGVRQSRFGVKSYTSTGMGDLKTIFEFELFGVGVDAGQTTFRLRHAWGELGAWGAGQTWSPFMDPDVFPNSIEYWGPNGMVFFRNVQLRWTPIQGDNIFMVALERPGASGDAGVVADRVELSGIQARFPAPDLSAQYRMNRDWGHLQFSGIVRYIKWDDTLADPFDLSGSAVGWGAHVATNLNFGPGVFRGSVVYGEGIQNYMNDAPVDVGATLNPGNPVTPIDGEALPILGVVAFYDVNWSDAWSTSVGYSLVDIDNSDLQSASAFQKGQYALVNLLHTPVKNVMYGPELQWGKRTNNSDGFSSDDFRIQFSAKYTFGKTFGGK
jgi:hypothetical protein